MLDTLRFVRGAVATKDLIPVLTHYHISKGRIQGGNSRICIDAPIDMDMDITVPAERFFKAIDSCEKEPTIKLTEGGKLSIKSGSFKATLPLSTDPFPLTQPTGTAYQMGEGFILALNRIRPFITDDATRPWACGALIKKGKIYATNNVILCQIDFPVSFPEEVVIPIYTIDELIRIGKNPTSIKIAENQVTFFYPEDRWLTSNLFNVKWPDLEHYFDFSIEGIPLIPTGLYSAVLKIIPFLPNSLVPTVYFKTTGVETGDGNVGATVDNILFEKDSCFNATMIIKVLEIATHLDFSPYPKPCPFSAPGVKGVVVGTRI
jgi:DNA polymerase III sliding clamp (beta) subunit (PCNA family)